MVILRRTGDSNSSRKNNKLTFKTMKKIAIFVALAAAASAQQDILTSVKDAAVNEAKNQVTAAINEKVSAATADAAEGASSITSKAADAKAEAEAKVDTAKAQIEASKAAAAEKKAASKANTRKKAKEATGKAVNTTR